MCAVHPYWMLKKGFDRLMNVRLTVFALALNGLMGSYDA